MFCHPLEIHYVCLHRYFVKYILSPQIKLVNINASDVVDGKSAVVLGLIWTIILYFQVMFHHEQTKSIL